RWQAKGNLSRGLGFPGGAVFICMRSFRERDKHKLIKLQRKLQQLKSTKIPYFLDRIAQES
ncbi:MAG TPA: hypothetical protein VM577_08600, partial [Anaerovoracaceae bacterium]|nr:hypothetical protein [Anaerovoracaceae bacterium]